MMTKEQRIANMAADIESWTVVEDGEESYLEVMCGDFLIEMDLIDIPNIETLTTEELATIIFNKYLQD